MLFSQSRTEEQHYFFYLTTPYFETLEIEENTNGTLRITSLESEEENRIYNRYKVYEFQRAFPNTLKEQMEIIYRISVNNPKLLEELHNYDEEKYYGISEFFPVKNAVYPNDYGTTSPVENLGAPYPLTGLDVINAPGAWGITTGNKKVVIGVSDTRIDSTNMDLQGRISNYLRYSNQTSGSTCSHGTTTAGIIGAIADNAYGLPGICSDCDMIAHGYGGINYIQELVEAGAKVINASWTLCGFGMYHKNVEERINQYYDEGILIVASAGNAKRCNRNLRDHASNYGYPASYKRVISVTSTYGDCGHYEDCIVDDPQFGIIGNKLKDRHVGRQRMKVEGSFDELTPINSQWATQHNLAVDITAPAETFLLGRTECGDSMEYGGVTSTSAAVVTGVIGLIWSANYCLGSAEVESILKLTAADIENIPGNEPFKMKLGAGRIDAYKAVKMAHDMQQKTGTVDVSGRDFYRFEFTLKSSPYQIAIQNQRFRDSATVDFKARKRIHLKSGTHLKPDENGFVKLSIDPNLPTEECFPKAVVPKPKVERDSVNSTPRFNAPFEIYADVILKGVVVKPVENEIDSDYDVLIKQGEETVFSKKYKQDETAEIRLEALKNERITVSVTTRLKRMEKDLIVNRD